MGIGRWARGCEEFGKQCALRPHPPVQPVVVEGTCAYHLSLIVLGALCVCVVCVHLAGMSPVSGARHRCVDCPLSHVVACTFLRFAPKCLVHDTTSKAFVHWRRLGVLTMMDSLRLLRVRRGSLQSGGVVETTTATSATVRACQFQESTLSSSLWSIPVHILSECSASHIGACLSDGVSNK
jgi:hypothetical protein